MRMSRSVRWVSFELVRIASPLASSMPSNSTPMVAPTRVRWVSSLLVVSSKVHGNHYCQRVVAMDA